MVLEFKFFLYFKRKQENLLTELGTIQPSGSHISLCIRITWKTCKAQVSGLTPRVSDSEGLGPVNLHF